jgi:hypothetical protein
MRGLAPKHASIVGRVIAALPGNNQDKFHAGVGGAPKEIVERLMRPRLRHAVQIDLIVDMRFSREQFAFQTPVQRHDRMKRRRRRFSLRLRTRRTLLA